MKPAPISGSLKYAISVLYNHIKLDYKFPEKVAKLDDIVPYLAENGIEMECMIKALTHINHHGNLMNSHESATDDISLYLMVGLWIDKDKPNSNGTAPVPVYAAVPNSHSQKFCDEYVHPFGPNDIKKFEDLVKQYFENNSS